MPKPLMSVGDLERTSDEFVEKWAVLEPELPARIVAERLDADTDLGFQDELSRTLRLVYYTRRIRGYRLRRRRKEQMPIPGYEHLPRVITNANGKRLDWMQASDSDVARLYRERLKRYGQRKDSDPVLAELKMLQEEMGKMRKRRKMKGKRITVGEFLNLSQ